MIQASTLTGGISSLEPDDRPDRPHWEHVDAERRATLDAECRAAAAKVRRAANQRALARAQRAFEAVPSAHIATLLRESREGMEDAANPDKDTDPDPQAWHHHAMAAVVLMRECSRRRGDPDAGYLAWLDQVEAALDAGDLYESLEFPPYTGRIR